MREKGNNRSPDSDDFMKYRQNNLDGKEQNRIERELQKDQFASEAMEGYLSTDPAGLKQDLNKLRRRLDRRTGKGRSMVIYRIAASFAVIMLIGSLYLLINQRSQDVAEKISMSERTPEVSAPQNPTEPVKDRVPADQERKLPAGKGKEAAAELPAPVSALNETQQKASEPIPELPVKKEVEMAAAENPVIKHALALADSISERESISDNIYITGEKKLSERAKSVAAGAPAARSEEYSAAPLVSDRAPEPVGGMEEYNRYIRENLRKPAGWNKSDSLTVNLVLLITASGTPDSIRVLRNPPDYYADEAVRIVREGPAWKPATRNGKAVEEKVYLKIEFK